LHYVDPGALRIILAPYLVVASSFGEEWISSCREREGDNKRERERERASFQQGVFRNYLETENPEMNSDSIIPEMNLRNENDLLIHVIVFVKYGVS
jgi:hypothetical protein